MPVRSPEVIAIRCCVRPYRFTLTLTPRWLDLPPSPDQKPGPEGVKPILHGLIDAFPDLVATIEEVIGEENRAAARVSLSGTHLGPLMGLPASAST
jgi:hypothetical protein